MGYELPNLPYALDALAPVMDSETLKIHHGAHHKAYVEKLNKALVKHPSFEEPPLEDLLANIQELPPDIMEDVRNHGGGHYNHSFFWTIMTTPQGLKPKGTLEQKLVSTFGSVANFETKFTEVANSHFGSGWAWLSLDTKGGLVVHSLPNQDTPLALGWQPVMLLDLWEHAYYLQYQNHRDQFTKAWWKIVNWPEVQRRYEAAEFHLKQHIRKAG